MSYIDGFVIAVPTANKQKFIEHAGMVDDRQTQIESSLKRLRITQLDARRFCNREVLELESPVDELAAFEGVGGHGWAQLF